jgi:hypothetical protein
MLNRAGAGCTAAVRRHYSLARALIFMGVRRLARVWYLPRDMSCYWCNVRQDLKEAERQNIFASRKYVLCLISTTTTPAEIATLRSQVI